MARGSRDSKRGWLCCESCHGFGGSDASPVCLQCAGLGPPPTHLSRDIVTAYRGRPRAVRPIRARFPADRRSDALASSARVLTYFRREIRQHLSGIFESAMNAPPRASMEMIPMLDLRAQFESISAEIRTAVDEVFTSQKFILGPHGEALEDEIARSCGVRHAVGVASGTEALELGLHACGVGLGDEVIVPAFTFIATGSAVSAIGARPVFADIEPATFNLDPEQIEARITPRTRAIVVVHLFGLSADMDPILAIAGKHGISVIEDNAQSFGAAYHGRKTGSMG